MPRLDGVRGVALLAVMIFHFLRSDHARSVAARALVFCGDMGWAGVDLFFALSGFLITGILLRTKSEPSYFRNFYVRRLLRIFPLYYGVLFAMFVLLPHLASIDALGAGRIFGHQAWFWAYSMNVGEAVFGGRYFVSEWLWVEHLWSLCIEEHFYLLWPLVVWLAKPETLLRVTVATALGTLALRCGLLIAHVPAWTIYSLTPCHLDGLALGSAVAVVRQHPARFARLRRVAPWGVALGATYLVAATAVTRHAIDFENWTMQTAGYSAIAVASSSSLVLVLDAESNPVSRALEGTILRTFGKYSYGAYVIHHFTLPVFLRWMPFAGLVAATGSEVAAIAIQLVTQGGLAMLLAFASWHLYEKHFLKLKERFEHVPTAQAVETAE